MYYDSIENLQANYKKEFDRIWDAFIKSYPRRLRELRENAHFGTKVNQADMAAILASHPDVNIKKSMYSRLEGGDIVPPVKTIIALMALHNISLGQASGIEPLSLTKSAENSKKFRESKSLQLTEALEVSADYLMSEVKKRKEM